MYSCYLLTPRSVSDNELFDDIRPILHHGEYEIPKERQFNGTGGPGNYLENLLQVETNNMDMPDAGRWEIKFTPFTTLLTLFHKDPQPSGIMRRVVTEWGWLNERQQTSFRHTLCGQSNLGLKVYLEDEKLIVRHNNGGPEPYWTHDDLINAASAKLRKLILVRGKVRTGEDKRFVTYSEATRYSGFRVTQFLQAIERGDICIDFDARTTGTVTGGLRNHGTKFRIKPVNLAGFYTEVMQIT